MKTILRCLLAVPVLMSAQSLSAAAFPEVQPRNVPNTGQCIRPLQELAAKAVAERLYRCKDGTVASELAILPGIIQRLPQSYFIDRVLTERIGRREKKLNIALDGADEVEFAQTLAMDCSAAGRYLFVGSAEGAVRMWDVDGDSMKTIGIGDRIVSSIACTADGSHCIATSSAGVTQIFDIEKGTSRQEGPLLFSVACSDDGLQFFAGGLQGRIGFVKEVLHDEQQPVHSENALALRIACSADGTIVFSGLENGARMMWDRRSGTVRRVSKGLAQWSPVLALVCDDEGKRLFSADGCSHFRACLIGEKDRVRISAKHDGYIHALACTADGKRVFSGTNKGNMYEAREEDDFYRNSYVIGKTCVDGMPGAVYALACNADGSRLFSASPGLLAMWTDYMQDLSALDTEALQLLFQAAQVWHETDDPLLIDLQDDRWKGLLSRYSYLQHEKLFVRPA